MDAEAGEDRAWHLGVDAAVGVGDASEGEVPVDAAADDGLGVGEED